MLNGGQDMLVDIRNQTLGVSKPLVGAARRKG